jgi:peptide chain release factor 1
MKPSMRAKLDHLDTRLAELNSLLTTEESTKDMDNYRKLTREHSDIATLVEQFGLYKQAEADAQAAEEMRKDPEMKDFADEEQKQAQKTMEELDSGGRAQPQAAEAGPLAECVAPTHTQ